MVEIKQLCTSQSAVWTQLPESILPTGCRSSGHCLRLAMKFKGPNTSLKSAIIWKSRGNIFKPENQALFNHWLPNPAERFLLIHRRTWVVLAPAPETYNGEFGGSVVMCEFRSSTVFLMQGSLKSRIPGCQESYNHHGWLSSGHEELKILPADSISRICTCPPPEVTSNDCPRRLCQHLESFLIGLGKWGCEILPYRRRAFNQSWTQLSTTPRKLGRGNWDLSGLTISPPPILPYPRSIWI